MARFAYIARDSSGSRQEGTLEGTTEQSVVAELSSRGLTPVRVVERTARQSGRGRVGVRAVAKSYRQLADLLRAGVPLLKALRLLARGRANPRLSRVMGQVADAVSEGDRLADAMGRHEAVFPVIHVAMIRAGERGGFLEDVLARLGQYLEQQAEMRSKVVGQLIYPVVLLAVGGLMVVFALVFFVPRFKGYYKNIELPWATQILMGASDALVSGWPYVLAGAAIAIAGVVVALRRPRVQRFIAIVKFRTPVIGPILKGLSVARFTRMLGTLLENGIAMLAAMKISRDAAGHPLMVEAIDRATEAVRSGASLAAPLGESGLFEEDTVEMIAVGESANNLPDVLVTLAQTVERRVEGQLSVMIRLLEPLLLLLMGMVVLFIFMALIVPMLRMSSV